MNGFPLLEYIGILIVYFIGESPIIGMINGFP
jgi:hypothetical protein